mgnify:FL=1
MWEEKLKVYDALVAKCPRFKRKGKTMPYTSANGYMFSLLNKDGEIGIRFSKEVQEKYIKEFPTTIYKSYGAVMKGYILIPESMWVDSISEPRVMRFPEYTDVVFPLTKEMDFEIIPTAGWTKPMADERTEKLKAISEDSTRVSDWKAYLKGTRLSYSMYQSTGKVNDPYFIHTDGYDSIQDIALQPYNRLFNVELGLGGWKNINIAHYWNIEKALEKHSYVGKRFLIIYGAGHKGWVLRQLRKRDDIQLLRMKPFLDAIQEL